ncbi:hypothetical protein DFH28DRAFT_922980 [Melampsora americana]|nr:hypothetical protein DFH28DRAFT_922980 [Melampsora americana]
MRANYVPPPIFAATNGFMKRLYLKFGKAKRSFQKANVETLKRFIDKVQDATVLAKGSLGPMKISLETKEKSLAYKFKLTICQEDQDISMRDQCSTTEQSLGSVIIRLALAKMLSSEGFPILCLDDPTVAL